MHICIKVPKRTNVSECNEIKFLTKLFSHKRERKLTDFFICTNQKSSIFVFVCLFLKFNFDLLPSRTVKNSLKLKETQ